MHSYEIGRRIRERDAGFKIRPETEDKAVSTLIFSCETG